MTMMTSIFLLSALQVVPAVRSEKISSDPLPREGYRIRIDSAGRVNVEAADAAGRFYAEQTLRQLPRPLSPCEIEDAPAFSWRGVHLDESRHFFGKETVKRILEQMASLKLNVFHWHLMDNQGNRIPLKRRPRMNTVGAQRPAPDYSRHVEDLAFGVYGPFVYTAEEIAEVCAYAKARHIRIVPEVEIPGHSREVIAAYPELFCGTPEEFCQACAHMHESPAFKIGATVVCLGNPQTIRFFEDVLDDVCELFPEADVIHIGGDECPRGNWDRCPKCQTKKSELGLKDAAALQGWYVRHFVDYLAKKGRRAIGWDEILADGLAEGALVMSWHGAGGGRAAAKAGHGAVMCPHASCYFDYPQGLETTRDPCRYPGWAPQLPLEKVYAFDPCVGIPDGDRKYILGGQANNWTEMTKNEEELQRKMWPRTAAMAEVLWTGPKKRTFEDFKSRLLPFVERQRQAGIAVSELPES